MAAATFDNGSVVCMTDQSVGTGVSVLTADPDSQYEITQIAVTTDGVGGQFTIQFTTGDTNPFFGIQDVAVKSQFGLGFTKIAGRVGAGVTVTSPTSKWSLFMRYRKKQDSD